MASKKKRQEHQGARNFNTRPGQDQGRQANDLRHQPAIHVDHGRPNRQHKAAPLAQRQALQATFPANSANPTSFLNAPVVTVSNKTPRGRMVSRSAPGAKPGALGARSKKTSTATGCSCSKKPATKGSAAWARKVNAVLSGVLHTGLYRQISKLQIGQLSSMPKQNDPKNKTIA